MKKIFTLLAVALMATWWTNYAQAADTEDPKPGTLSIAEVTTTSIKLSWTKATDNVTPQNKLKYRATWKKKSDDSWTHSSYYMNITEYTINNLEPDTEYQVTALVKDEADNWKWYSGAITVRTKKDTEPPKKNKLMINKVTNKSIQLSWIKSTDNVTPQNKLRYKVEWWEQGKLASTYRQSGLKTNMTSYTITGLKPDTEYKVDVQVRDEADNYIGYGEKALRTKATADSEKPKVGKTHLGEVTTNSINITWTSATDNVTPQNELRYKVWWRKKSGSWLYTANFLTTTSYKITSLESDCEYEIKVVVTDKNDNVAYYEDITARTKATPDTEKPKTGTITIGKVTATSIKLSWTKGTDNVTPQDELQYKVWWGNPATADQWRSNLLTNETSYTITGLEPDTEYDIDVIVYDKAGNEKYYNDDKTVTTKSATVSVTSVTLSSSTLELEVGSTGALTAKVLPDNASDKTITWKSSNTAVATVDGSGTVKGIAAGTAVITVTTDDGGKTATANVTVKAATTPVVKVSSLTLNKNSVTINGDAETVQLTVSVAPSTASDKSVTWMSDKPTVASVDASGVVTIHKKGKATITVTANDGSGVYDECVFDVLSTVSNNTIDGLEIYAHANALHLTLPASQTVHIYNMSGTTVKTLTLGAGKHVLPLTEGLYIVRVDNTVRKVIIGK